MGKPKRPAPAPDAPRFTGKDLIGEMLDRDPRVEAVLLEYGLPCQSCVVKDYETLEQGCIPLGLKAPEILARLNALPADQKG